MSIGARRCRLFTADGARKEEDEATPDLVAEIRCEAIPICRRTMGRRNIGTFSLFPAETEELSGRCPKTENTIEGGMVAREES